MFASIVRIFNGFFNATFLNSAEILLNSVFNAFFSRKNSFNLKFLLKHFVQKVTTCISKNLKNKINIIKEISP